MKKFSLVALFVAFSLVVFNFINVNPVSASVDTNLQVLQNAYQTLCEYDDDGGCLKDENLESCYQVSGQGFSAVEELYEYFAGEGVSSQQKIQFSTWREKVLKTYRDTTKKKLSAYYHPENYANSENGSIKLTNDYNTAISKIDEQDATKSSIDDAYQGFVALVEEDDYVKNMSSLYTQSDSGQIQGSLVRVDGKLIFSPDDKLILNNYNSSSTIKNVNVALKDVEGLVGQDNSGEDKKSYYGHGYGVAYYYDIQWDNNGKYNQIDSECIVTIDFSSIETQLQDGQGVYVVQYLGNGEIDLSNEIIIENGKISFTISASGAYAIVADGYGIANASKFLWFLQEFWLYLTLILIVIILITLPIIYSKRLKKKLAKKYNKKFKKFLKDEKRNKKLAKKEKRKQKTLKKQKKQEEQQNLQVENDLKEEDLTDKPLSNEEEKPSKNEKKAKKVKNKATDKVEEKVEQKVEEKQELTKQGGQAEKPSTEQPTNASQDKKPAENGKAEKDKKPAQENKASEDKVISEDKKIEKSLKSKEDEEIKKVLTSKEDEEIKKVLKPSNKSK